ncbi:MAG: tetratricopeptide repeat protein [Terracidiphilus sp.]|jgi:tetratricopeptide (TPR) repeat protein
MRTASRSEVALITVILFSSVSCSTRGRIDSVIRGFFGEVNRSNFETAKADYLATSLINEFNAPPALGGNQKTIQQSFQPVAGSIDSVEVAGEAVKGEGATAVVTLVLAWGTKESGSIELIKEGGKAWKILRWDDFKALGSEHIANAVNLCNFRNLGGAVAEYQAALDENPRDSMILNSLGVCYQTVGKLDEAEAQYKKAVDLHPSGVWDPYINLGGIYAQRGEVSKAEDAFQRAIKNKPDNAGAYNLLAWMYADKGIDLDKAIELAQKGIQLAPDDAHIFDTLGWAYYRKGMKAEAVRYLAQAAARAPNSAEIRSHYEEASTTAAVHLARAQQLMNEGRFDQAANECEAALRQEPDNGTAKSLKAGIGKEAALRHVTNAKQLLEKQLYDPALSECDVALRFDPQSADAANLKAKIADTKKVLGYQ